MRRLQKREDIRVRSKERYFFIIRSARSGDIFSVRLDQFHIHLWATLLLVIFSVLVVLGSQLWAYSQMKLIALRDAELVFAFQAYDSARSAEISQLTAKVNALSVELTNMLNTVNQINQTLISSGQKWSEVKGAKGLGIVASATDDIASIFTASASERSASSYLLNENVEEYSQYGVTSQMRQLEEASVVINHISNTLARLGAVRDKLEVDAEKYATLMDHIPTLWPCSGYVASGFGWRRDPVIPGRYEFHEGIDIAAPYGTPVYAAASGKVIAAWWNGGYGRTVIIDHGNGLRTVYAHLLKIDVKVGQVVKKGQKIGEVGSTGRSTGPHLHFEVRVWGVPVDPMRYLSRR